MLFFADLLRGVRKRKLKLGFDVEVLLPYLGTLEVHTFVRFEPFQAVTGRNHDTLLVQREILDGVRLASHEKISFHLVLWSAPIVSYW